MFYKKYLCALVTAAAMITYAMTLTAFAHPINDKKRLTPRITKGDIAIQLGKV